MLTDRRPILLANARVVDPSRDFDGPGAASVRPAFPKAPTSSIAPA
jgi:hypothetical protein